MGLLSTMNIYLCGPINGCTDDEAITWRDWFKSQETFFDFIDPMKRDYRGRETEDYREIVDLDKLDVRNSDAVVVMYTQPSVGTSMEILYAWTIGKPVVVINESNKPLSPWLRYHSTAIVRTKELALKKIEEFTK
jgi:nucleoside 2-deoxyribosyltransferase